MTAAPGRPRNGTATLAVLAVLATACGSTFPADPAGPVIAGEVPTQDEPARTGAGDGLGLDPAEPSGSSESAGPSGSAATSSGSGAGEVAAGTPSARTADPAGSGPDATDAGEPADASRPAASSSGSQGGRAVAPGTVGIDDDEVRVGLTYTEDSNQANSALGAGGITTGDQRRNYEVLLDHFNERGGAAGRRIVPVYHRYEATSSQPYAVQEQAACATFTQDDPVFVSLAGGLPGLSDGTFSACMQAAGTPVLASGGLSDQNDASFERWPDFVQTQTLSLDAIARLWPASLAETGYFEPRTPTAETRVGVVTYDTETMRSTLERSLRPALAAVGQDIHVEAYVRQPSSFSDVSDLSAEIQNAVLRFRSAGVQHVLIQDAGNALLTLLFMNSAEGQGYRPRYGMTTNNGGQALVGAVPQAQFAEARLVGWIPGLDVPSGSFDEPMGEGRELCDAIYAEAGIAFSDPNAQLVAYGQCDEFRSLLAAFEAGSGTISQATFVDDFVAVGTGFESAIVGPTKFTRERRYGVARHRLAAFSGDCGCFTYTTPWRETP